MISIIYLIGVLLSFGNINAIENGWVRYGFKKQWIWIVIFSLQSWFGLIFCIVIRLLLAYDFPIKIKTFDFKLKP